MFCWVIGIIRQNNPRLILADEYLRESMGTYKADGVAALSAFF